MLHSFSILQKATTEERKDKEKMLNYEICGVVIFFMFKSKVLQMHVTL